MPADRPAVFTIPPHVAFVDALAKGLIERAEGDRLRLARVTVLLPNRRAVRALTDAFVRFSDGGLLLPRMAPIGDADEDVALSSFADDMQAGAAIGPAVDDCKQRLILTGLVKRYLTAGDDRATTVEALRLANDLRSTLGQLLAEDMDATRLAAIDVGDLAAHWQKTLRFLDIIAREWPAILADEGETDAARRRNDLLRAWIARLDASPPADPIIAAGMSAATPLVAKLLGRIARLPAGMIVLPGLDCAMSDDEWEAIECRAEGEERTPSSRDSEAHPQFAFRCLLQRMGVARREIETWSWTSDFDGPAARTAAIARAMAPAAFTGAWRDLDLDGDAMGGVRLVEAATPGEEAQVIALAMRRQLVTPGKTAALVTPDRGLARRVAAQLARWGVELDDSAGVPLARTPPGAFLQALTEAAAERFSPVPLLALVKHPLVRRGERLGWLDSARALDMAVRGVRPPPGLDAIGGHLQGKRLEATERGDAAGERKLLALEEWWAGAAPILEPLERLFAAPTVSLPRLIDCLRAAGEALCGDDLWRGPAGRALGAIVEQLERHGDRLDPFDPPDAPGLLAAFLGETAVRPAFGKHPRLAVYGLLEARLQRADLMILGGLNEGVWPAPPQPDPWLAPAARRQLGLPGLERRIGLAAHDFVQAIGAKEVIVTRARRDASAPTVASRFWLRLEALGGEKLKRDHELPALARALDACAQPVGAKRPSFAPPLKARPRRISVTAADKLKADPFSFYAESVLGLRKLHALDEDPTAAERGIFLHKVLEDWIREKPEDPAHLLTLARHRLGEWDHHPTMKALWAPRALRAVEWVAETMAAWEAEGWRPVKAEGKGRLTLGNGVTLTGKADRIDVNAGGGLAIVDYKTGAPPSHDQLSKGYALQLGLLAWLASDGHVEGVAKGAVEALRYWKLSGGQDRGKAVDPLMFNRQPWSTPGDFIDQSMAWFFELCDAYLLGDAPFTAKLHPDYSTRYVDHDHLARVAEWLGRGDAA